jgi:hypothetical protein
MLSFMSLGVLGACVKNIFASPLYMERFFSRILHMHIHRCFPRILHASQKTILRYCPFTKEFNYFRKHSLKMK